MEDSDDVRSDLKINCVINRWIVDYYLYVAFNAFRNGQYENFCEIRDLLQSLVCRPMESNKNMPNKIRALQFLSRINDGDKPDVVVYDLETNLTPLESALGVLDSISQECTGVLQPDLERVHKSIREMLVIVCIKNKKFEKAKEVLATHFPKSMVGKKAVFMSLVKQKCIEHPVLNQVTYQQFKEEMLQFSESMYINSVPFLKQAAIVLVEKRMESDEAGGASSPQPEECAVPEQPPSPQGAKAGKHKPSVQICRQRLCAVFTAMAEEYREPTTFSQLSDTQQRELQQYSAGGDFSLSLSESPLKGLDAEPEQGSLSQRNSGSPAEASPADEPPNVEAVSPVAEAAPRRRRQLYTVARMVMDPDSQASEQESTASQEEEEEEEAPAARLEEEAPAARPEEEAPAARLEEARPSVSREAPMTPSSAGTSSPLVRRVRTCKRFRESVSDSSEDAHVLENTPARRTRASNGHIQASSTNHNPMKHPDSKKWKLRMKEADSTKDTWSDEESLFDVCKDASEDGNVVWGQKKWWTIEETDWLIQGVSRHGEGNWSQIKQSFPFTDRTVVNLKDRWRTLKKLHMV